MVKYFGDAHHGQLMLQESNEVGLISNCGLLVAISFCWLFIGSCLLCWKISLVEKQTKWVEALRLRQNNQFNHEQKIAANGEINCDKQFNTVTINGTYANTTNVTIKKGTYIGQICMIRFDLGSSTGGIQFRATPKQVHQAGAKFNLSDSQQEQAAFTLVWWGEDWNVSGWSVNRLEDTATAAIGLY